MTIPLTTVFTPPSGCFSTLEGGFGAYAIAYGTTCIPPGAQPSDRSFAFSPALNCPQSFTTVTTTTSTVGNNIETRAICCPVFDGIRELSGGAFTFNPDTTLHPWFKTYGCLFTTNPNANIVVHTGPSSNLIAFTAPDFFDAYSVQIAWQASDLPGRASPTPTRPASTPASTSVPSPTSNVASFSFSQQSTLKTAASTSGTGTPSGQSSGQSSGQNASATGSSSNAGSPSTTSLVSSSAVTQSTGISDSAKIAIGVIIPVIVLAAIAVIAVVLIGRRKQRRQPIMSGWGKGQDQLAGPGLFMEEHPQTMYQR